MANYKYSEVATTETHFPDSDVENISVLNTDRTARYSRPLSSNYGDDAWLPSRPTKDSSTLATSEELTMLARRPTDYDDQLAIFPRKLNPSFPPRLNNLCDKNLKNENNCTSSAFSRDLSRDRVAVMVRGITITSSVLMCVALMKLFIEYSLLENNTSSKPVDNFRGKNLYY